MPDELFNIWILLPALVAALSGLLAYARGHPGWAVGLACAGFAGLFAFAFAAVFLGIVLRGGMIVGVAIWGAVAVYWLIAAIIIYSLGSKPPR